VVLCREPSRVTCHYQVYLKRSELDRSDVPKGFVTVMSTVPEPAGATALIEVILNTVYELAGVLPNFTAVTPVKSVPVMVTLVPAGPEVGERAVTLGGAP
jgi:hypothetical protein